MTSKLLYRGGALSRAAAIVFVGLLSAAQPLCASLDADVPEVPNFFTLLHLLFGDSPLAFFLHGWDSVVFSLLLAAGLVWIFHLGTRKIEKVPTGLQNFLESVVSIFDKFVTEIIGPEGRKFVPFLGTLFIYILGMNWLALVPFMKAPSSNFSITVALALCVFGLVQYLNIKNFGFRGFLYHLAGSPKSAIEWALVPLMLVIELITQLTRPITLALRLFGNVVGEDILIGAFALFGVMLVGAQEIPIGIPLQIPFMFFSIMTGFMQALVFTLLSAVYILLSMPHADEQTAHGEQSPLQTPLH
jgi:F-type H+-transporting ATPase subunit a